MVGRIQGVQRRQHPLVVLADQNPSLLPFRVEVLCSAHDRGNPKP